MTLHALRAWLSRVTFRTVPAPPTPLAAVCSRCGVLSTPSEFGICVEVNADAVAVEEFLRMDLQMARSGL